MGDLTCPACRERKDTGHTHDKGCMMLSPEQLAQRQRERDRYLKECERSGENPYYDTREERDMDK